MDPGDTAQSTSPPSLAFLADMKELAAGGASLVAVFYAVVRVAYEGYYARLGLTPEAVGLGESAIVSRAAVYATTALLLVAVWFGFAVAAYRIAAPIQGRYASATGVFDNLALAALQVVVLLVFGAVPVLCLRYLAPGPGSRTVASVVPAAVGNAVFFAGIFAAALDGDRATRLRKFWTKHLAGGTRVFALTLVTALVIAWAMNLSSGADQAGREVRAEGTLSTKFSYLNVIASPSRVIPKGSDPLHICADARKAVLVGRHQGTSYVLLLPSEQSDGPSEVVPLLDEDYAVATATAEPQPCKPKSP